MSETDHSVKVHSKPPKFPRPMGQFLAVKRADYKVSVEFGVNAGETTFEQILQQEDQKYTETHSYK